MEHIVPELDGSLRELLCQQQQLGGMHDMHLDTVTVTERDGLIEMRVLWQHGDQWLGMRRRFSDRLLFDYIPFYYKRWYLFNAHDPMGIRRELSDFGRQWPAMMTEEIMREIRKCVMR